MTNNSIQDSNTDEGRFAISLLAKKNYNKYIIDIYWDYIYLI